MSSTENNVSEREAMYRKYLEFASLVKGGVVKAHWMADGDGLWYAEGAPDQTVIYKVDPTANTKDPLFDALRLREALTPHLGHQPPSEWLPYRTCWLSCIALAPRTRSRASTNGAWRLPVSVTSFLMQLYPVRQQSL